RFPLGLVAGVVVDAVVLDPLDRDELLPAGRALVSQDGVLLVVEQLFLLRDDEELRAVLAPADVLQRSVPDELLQHRRAGQRTELLRRLGVADLAVRAG